MARSVRLTVEAEHQGMRLDQYLAQQIDELSRRKARVLLDIGGVFVDKKRIKVASRKLRTGQVVEVHLGGALERATKKVGRAARERDRATQPEISILHRDDDIVVVCKPAGLLTAPTPESDQQNLAAELERQLGEEVFVVHRLDLETSGVLVLARTPRANRFLSELFRTHDVEREYWLVVEGAWPEDLREIATPIAEKSARTHFEVKARYGQRATHLAARLDTGRTHQIRIHTSEAGHPVLGDSRYGAGLTGGAPRMALHARVLGLSHPTSGQAMRWETEPPDALLDWAVSLSGT